MRLPAVFHLFPWTQADYTVRTVKLWLVPDYNKYNACR